MNITAFNDIQVLEEELKKSKSKYSACIDVALELNCKDDDLEVIIAYYRWKIRKIQKAIHNACAIEREFRHRLIQKYENMNIFEFLETFK